MELRRRIMLLALRIFEIKGISTSGPFAFGDIILAGLYNPDTYFVQSVSTAQMHADGTFTQTISLSAGLAESITAGNEIVSSIGTIDFSITDDPSTVENEQFTLGDAAAYIESIYPTMRRELCSALTQL